MGKALIGIIAAGATIATAGALAPVLSGVLSGTIVGALGGTFTALGVAQAAIGALSLGIASFAVGQVGGLLGLGPSIPKPDQTVTAIKAPRPPRVSAYGESRLYGAYILYETASNGTAIDVHAVHDGQLTEVVQFYLADDKITRAGNVVQEGEDGRYGDGKLSLYHTTGATPGTPFSAVASALPGIWTSNHRGDGIVLMALLSQSVKSKNFLDIYPNGVPVPSMAAKWQKCPDLHAGDPTNEAGWTWTENAVRQLAHYMLVREGADYATKIAPAIDMWRAAQDVCNEAVPLKAGGTEARYRSCLAHRHTDKHGDVKAALLGICDGWMATRSDGAYAIYAGKYYAPTVTIAGEHIVSYEWQGVGVDDDSAVNEIVCSYVSKAHDYNSVETDAWRNESDIAERGSILSETLDVQTPSWGQVRRLAKRRMARANALYRGTVTTNIKGRIARGHRFIHLTLAEAGAVFFDGPAEITAVTRNMMTGGITFSWVAADPNIDAWNPATEEGDPAAVGDRVAPEPLEKPIIVSALFFESGADGSRIRITATGPIRDDLTWFVRQKPTTSTVWNEREYNDLDAGASVLIETEFVATDADVEVQVAYQVGDGRTSPWSSSETVTTGAVSFDSTTFTFDSTSSSMDRT
ncbi:hypothetical protein [Sphingobium sp. CFD-1]|uniref:hypothetical protein n=1 Tax=Sphingobium sp. CFD-1 TaxID=2878545 RepID=UPI00214BD6FD|nr:hypothetical protein [Sphingobium sp. CFD-1]